MSPFSPLQIEAPYNREKEVKTDEGIEKVRVDQPDEDARVSRNELLCRHERAPTSSDQVPPGLACRKSIQKTRFRVLLHSKATKDHCSIVSPGKQTEDPEIL